MIGYTIGIVITLGSEYVIKRSFDSLKEIQNNKNTLTNNIVEFKNINNISENVKCMTIINNKTYPKIFNSYGKRITTINNVIINGRLQKKDHIHILMKIGKYIFKKSKFKG